MSFTLDEINERSASNIALQNEIKRMRAEVIAHDTTADKWMELSKELLHHLERHCDEEGHARIISKARHMMLTI